MEFYSDYYDHEYKVALFMECHLGVIIVMQFNIKSSVGNNGQFKAWVDFRATYTQAVVINKIPGWLCVTCDLS